MKPQPLFISGFLAAACATLLFSAGCDRNANGANAEASRNDAEHAEHAESVTFKEGRGLQFLPEVLQALALKTADATERPLASEARLTAQIFATTPRTLASARVSQAQAAALENASAPGVKLLRADRSTTAATRLVEMVFELEKHETDNATDNETDNKTDSATTPAKSATDNTTTPAKNEIGSFITLTLTAPPVNALSVPRAAVLDGATGPFVYVINGGAYLRTPVKLGARSAEYMEITDGLYPGDVVVTTQVTQLWLAELRLTKGGGGCD